MAVHAGIACRSCGRVYFLTSAFIELCNWHSRPALLQLTCEICDEVRIFHEGDLCTYVVPTFAYERGYARVGDYTELARAG